MDIILITANKEIDLLETIQTLADEIKSDTDSDGNLQKYHFSEKAEEIIQEIADMGRNTDVYRAGKTMKDFDDFYNKIGKEKNSTWAFQRVVINAGHCDWESYQGVTRLCSIFLAYMPDVDDCLKKELAEQRNKN